MSSRFEPLRQRLLEELTESGDFRENWIRQAFERVPRHVFVPKTVWAWDGGAWRAVRRAREPERWAGLVYAHDAVVTQVDDGRTHLGGRGQEPTSSVSAPGAVLNMLASLAPGPGKECWKSARAAATTQRCCASGPARNTSSPSRWIRSLPGAPSGRCAGPDTRPRWSAPTVRSAGRSALPTSG